MSKYIDLAPEIEGLLDSLEVRAGIRAGLSWLDSHPDQVPVRTITASAERDLYDAAQSSGAEFTARLGEHGITIVPDPEPETTNAERLEKEIAVAWGVRLPNDGHDAHIAVIAVRLDAAGVKAPEGES